MLWKPPKTNATHLFWVEKVSRIPLDGHIKMQCVGIWAFDLEGFSPAWAGYDRYPQAIVRRAVKTIAILPEPKFSINVADADCWLQAVSDAAKAFLGQLHHI
ncbi:hypothetical protein [Trichocoleus sp. FACHB-40]|uniref:hypothetical protein n=1 Tax=Trichocoleus sp. FACHB-40 TaxID=2692870 RepID=UPI0016852B45|nr:hypothetical protein [Trichocoleus sp. FACHB-40]MBD2002116.1 hypothetical protein [Trichocoleus sp. FACHB-40]